MTLISFKKYGSLLLIGLMLHVVAAGQLAYPQPYATTITTPNYVRVWDAVKPDSNRTNFIVTMSLTDARLSTTYADGFGRSVQSVIKQGSMVTGESAVDLVAPKTYDEFGRESVTYLPFAANSFGGNTSIGDGMFKRNPFQQDSLFNKNQFPGESYFYSLTNFEASPLKRPVETFSPGNSWVGTANEGLALNRRSIKTSYWFNTAADSVRVWDVSDISNDFGGYSTSGTYVPGTLNKTVSLDEHNNQLIEFKDKSGQVILRKVQLTAFSDTGSGKGHSGWMCTYYLYDQLNRLRAVVQPEGVKLLNQANWAGGTVSTLLAEQFFRYEYDKKGRMIRKKVPGAGSVLMVYDARDRVIMTQDSLMRVASPQQWLVTLYDDLDRPVQTGILKNSYAIGGIANGTFAQHGERADTTINYPFSASTSPSVTYWEWLTKSGYDDYASIPAGLTATYTTTWDTHLMPTDNLTYPYPQMPVQSLSTRGLATWSLVKVLGTVDQYLGSLIIYDEKGRVIQTKSQNISGGEDIVSTQYTWAGQPFITIQKQENASTPSQTSIIVTKLNYDELGRLLSTDKKIQNTLVDNNTMSAYKTIAQNEYDALGQLKSKVLAPNEGDYLEKLDYRYNIRGWLHSVNNDFVKDVDDSRYFGFNLGYDKQQNDLVNNQSYSQAQYNGNIAGMVWKSKGDSEKRKYDFDYDKANRLLKGDFTQYTGSTFNTSAGVNYDMKMGDGTQINIDQAYDYNGNIKRMQQWGLMVGGSGKIDSLAYTYYTNSNRLQKVTDGITADNKLGDFNNGGSGNDNDYAYDGNGNLVKDHNKNIGTTLVDGIIYNLLNLPSIITVRDAYNSSTVKGTVSYTYDAAGNKLKKTTVENSASVNYNDSVWTSSIITTTTYLGGTIFESKEYGNATLNTNLGYQHRLQFLGMEEGRVRLRDKDSTLHYDYMLKDHLGNVRMVLTEEEKIDTYPAASMETATTSLEESLYDNLSATRDDKPAGYPTDTFTDPNEKVAKVSGSGNKIGPSLTLKVMAGDKFNLRVSSWYKTGGETPGSPVNPLTDLAGALLNGVGGIVSGSHGTSAVTQLQNTGLLTTGATQFLATQDYAAGKPKAYVNWVLLDEQFKFVETGSGAEQVGNNEEFKIHFKENLPITKNGYLYVYVSNETPNINVFFDNLQVTHYRGPILEETHYYPFGLTMAGISSKVFNGPGENKYKWNKGSELQNKEFSDGSGLELYATFHRSLDPQIGRWHQIDSKPDYAQSLYASMINNPLRYNDPLGDTVDIDKNASQEFAEKYKKARTLLSDNKLDKNIVELEKSTEKYIVREENFEAFNASFRPNKNGKGGVIAWNPELGIKFNSGASLSPLGVLIHEVDHASQHNRNPKKRFKDTNTFNPDYENEEEKRVITGEEQRAAKKLNTLNGASETRKSHSGMDVNYFYRTTEVNGKDGGAILSEQLNRKR